METQTNYTLSPESKAELEFHKRLFSQIESFPGLCRDIIAKARPFDEIHNLEVGFGMRQVSKGEICSEENIDDIVLESMGDEPIEQMYALPLDSLKVNNFITPDDRTLIYGDSGVGKSYFAIEISIAFATGRKCFFFNETEPCKIVYLDGEMNSIFWPRTLQLNSKHGDVLDLLKRNLRVIKLRGKTLMSEKVRKKTKELLKNNNIKYVVIDNLMALFAGAVKGKTNVMVSFFQELEAIGIGIVFIHHTDKDGDNFMGPAEIESLSQNSLRLQGPKQIEEEYKKKKRDIPKPLMEAFTENGCSVIGIQTIKTKLCPDMLKKTLYYRLPKDGVWELIDIDANDNEVTENNCVKDAEDDTKNDVEMAVFSDVNYDQTATSIDLHVGGDNLKATMCEIRPPEEAVRMSQEQLFPKEEKVIAKTHERHFITNAGVQGLFEKCAKSTAGNILQRLCKNGWLKMSGKGRGTTYILTDKARSWLKDKNVEREG